LPFETLLFFDVFDKIMIPLYNTKIYVFFKRKSRKIAIFGCEKLYFDGKTFI